MVQLCGCYYDLDTEKCYPGIEPLPRVQVKAHTTIFSSASETELTQTFVNPSKTDDISECRYVFPLFGGVSVVAFTCQVGSRIINGVVKEKVEAKQAFDVAISRGETAGLLEQGPSIDVFVTSLGNIPAGELLRIKIKFIGELKHDMALQGVRFTLPTFISPRYGSDAPQGDMDSSLAEGMSITVDISMSTECPIEEVRSPSHPIALSLGRTSVQCDDTPDLSKASATLSLGEAALDRDFVLEVRHKDVGKPRAILETHPNIDGQRALMTTLMPQMGPLQGENPEVIIIADQSGSMQGGRTQTLVAALRVLLKSLPVGLKFNICAFGSHYSFLWQKSHTYDENSLKQALDFVGKFGGHLGGTETMRAVQASIESRDPKENLSLILATDGDIWQQHELFSYLDEQLAKSKKHIRVFPLGIGDSVSSGLIEGVARAGNGFASSVGEGEKLDVKVIRMLKGAMTPDSGNYTMEVEYYNDHDEEEYEIVERVTDSLRIMMVEDTKSTEEIGASAMVIDDKSPSKHTSFNTAGVMTPALLQTPQVVPPLYPLSRTTVYILLSPKATRATPKTVIFRGDAPENPFKMSIPVEVLSQPATTIHSLAAKRAVLELEEGRGWLRNAKNAQGQLIKGVIPEKKYDEMVKAEAVRLGVQYQITGKYTSSVAVESISSKENGEKLAERDITINPRPISPVANSQGVLASCSRSGGHGSSRSGGGNAHFSSFGRSSPSAPPPPSAAPRKRLGNFSSGTRGGGGLFGSATGGLVSRVGGGLFGSSRGGVAGFSDKRGGGGLSEEVTKSAAVNDDSDEDMGFGLEFDDSPVLDRSQLREMAVNHAPVRTTPTVSEQVQHLIDLQSFAGFWKYEKKVLEACSIAGFPKQPKKVDSRVWATLIALDFLDWKLSGEKETWEMVAQKAWAWLKAQGFDRQAEEGRVLMQEARILLEAA